MHEMIVGDPRELGLDPAKVEAAVERAGEEVGNGVLPSAQIAIARRGKIAAMRTFGAAVQDGALRPSTNETRYAVFSCTKAIVASAAWILIGEGKLDPARRVEEIVPEFGANDKHDVLIKHLFTHEGGFPSAPFPPTEWRDRRKRLERFASWRLEWPPGSRFVYHPVSGFWVIAEIIERVAGEDFRDFIRKRIAEPLGLEIGLGIPRDRQIGIADIAFVSEAPSKEELQSLGLDELETPVVSESALLGLNNPAVREIGIPAGGGVMTAGDLALFYQELLGELNGSGRGIWRREIIRDALRIRSGEHTDGFFGCPANRALGVIIAGGDGLASYRGFGANNSPLSFGHGGAGGQIGWADPVSGISFAYCTNGFDRNFIRQGRRGIAISTMAAACIEAGF